jgi:hypothetical protein
MTVQYVNILLNVLIIFGAIYLIFFKSYLREKGKNIATKEDIGDITGIVESIKRNNNIQIEKIKAELKSKDDILSIRRQVYTNMVNSLRIFISGHSQDKDIKEKFLSNYAIIWLWATDEIISKINDFLDSQIKRAANTDSVSQEKMKKLFTECLIAMRKDVGFNETKVKSEDYRFVNFS